VKHPSRNLPLPFQVNDRLVSSKLDVLVRVVFLLSLCRSGFATLPLTPLQEQPVVVLLWVRPLASWLLALGERGIHDDLYGLGHMSIIPYVHGRTELDCAQTCFT
jgi:hypothetical protein